MISLNVLSKSIKSWQVPLKLSLQQRSFGTDKKTLIKQRAMAANRILSLILEGDKEGKLFLSSQIADEMKNNNDLKHTFEANFKDLFDPQKGVELPQHLSTQSRIKNAVKKSSKKVAFFPDQLVSPSKKVAFFPNRLVSPDIFETIQQNNKKTLITGRPGIAKTTSLILYAHLSSIANEYKYLYDKDFKAFPLLIYFTYATQEDEIEKQNYMLRGWEDLKHSIKAQHLGKQQIFMEKISEKQLVETIVQKCNQKNIEVKFVIDQFNTMVRHIKNYNTMNEQYPSKQRTKDIFRIMKQKKQIKKQIKQLKKNVKQNFEEIVSLKKDQGLLIKQLDKISKIQDLKKNLQNQRYIIGQISSMSSGLILNSSKNVETDLLFVPRNGQNLTMKIQKHGGIIKKQIAYEEKLKKEWGKKELIRILIFEALKYTDNQLSQQIMFGEAKQDQQKKKNTVSETKQDQQKKNLVDSLYEEIETKNQIFTFLQIRESIEQKKEQLKSISDIQALKQFLKTQIESIYKQFYEGLKKNVQDFYETQSQISDQRKIILNLMCLKAEDSSDNQKLELQLSLSDLTTKASTKKQREINEYFDKTLFQYNVRESKLICIVSKEALLQSTKQLREDQTSTLRMYVKWFSLLQIFFQKERGLFGKFLQFVIIFILKQEGYKKKVSIKGKEQFEIQQIGKFEHFNKNIDYSLQPKMEQLIENSINLCHFAYPVTKGNKESSISKSIDFMITKNSEEENSSINIVSCDITVTDEQGIKNKIKKAEFLQKFREEINKQLNKKKKTISIKKWRHYIVYFNVASFKTVNKSLQETDENQNKKSNQKVSQEDNAQETIKKDFKIEVLKGNVDFVLTSNNKESQQLLRKIIWFAEKEKQKQ